MAEEVVTFWNTFLGSVIKWGAIPLLIGFILLVLGVLIYLFVIKKRTKDSMKAAYKKMYDNAIFNKRAAYDYMRVLRRMPISIEKAMQNNEDMKRVISTLNDKNTGVYMGDIIGYNKINFLATKEDLLKNVKVGSMSNEDGEVIGKNMDALIKGIGECLHVLVVKKKAGWFKTDKILLLVYDDQISGVNDAFGTVVVYGYGIEKFGEFGFLSGDPERVNPLITNIGIICHMDAVQMLFSNTSDLVAEAWRSDSGTHKAKELLTAARPSQDNSAKT